MLKTNFKIGRQCLYLFFGFILNIYPIVFSTSCAAAELYEKVQIDSNGQLHIVTTDNRDIVPSKRELKIGSKTENQVDFWLAVISDDKTTVGWLNRYPNCCTSYPIPLELVIYRNAKTERVFKGNEFPIWKWKFEAKGTQVAFKQEAVHGGAGVHFELREIKSGLLIDSHDGDPAPDAPVWIRDLTAKKIIQPEEK
ncbi:MAG: hypothetical protein ACHQUB_03805 [Candidatus Saccharimonadia bacterium]